jgi:hypothetical protein
MLSLCDELPGNFFRCFKLTVILILDTLIRVFNDNSVCHPGPNSYLCVSGLDKTDSILQNGSESYGGGIHKSIIYGDFFFIESILKLKKAGICLW